MSGKHDNPQLWHLVRARGSSPGLHPKRSSILPHQPPPFPPIMHHSPCLPDIQTSFFKAVLQGISSPLPQSTYLVTTCTLPHIHPLNNPIILHSLHMGEPSENIFINPFVFPNSFLISEFGTLSILLILSKPLRLSICTALILDLSF